VTFNDSKIIDEARNSGIWAELYDLVEREGRKKIILNFRPMSNSYPAPRSGSSSASTSAASSTAGADLIQYPPEIYEASPLRIDAKLFIIKDDEADALQRFSSRFHDDCGITATFNLVFGPHSGI